ncbi:MAG: site-2 protease family protein [Candidatus Marinimicrobia bacterium]|nr:site-2 protease family protein [Candidatus Neomarinimicrobiota bacterium]
MSNQIIDILALAIPILIAITFHEVSHGYVAWKHGDPTAKMMGRLTLNPLVHLDPIGTLMLFLVRFGWAKPVPVDPRYFKNPKKDMLWVALAGPACNMVLAFFFGLIIRGVGLQYSASFTGTFLKMVLLYGLYINLALAIFNLLPIPPLDGGRILRGLLPWRYEYIVDRLERYGPFVLMGLIFFEMFTGIDIFGAFITPFVRFFGRLFAGINL